MDTTANSFCPIKDSVQFNDIRIVSHAQSRNRNLVNKNIFEINIA